MISYPKHNIQSSLNIVILIIFPIIFSIIFSLSCSSTAIDQQDPLKNTKSLAVKGHTSLYENGAFQIPHTSVKLIPSWDESMSLSTHLGLYSSKASFRVAVSQIKESVLFVKKGAVKSYQASKDVSDQWSKLSEEFDKQTEETGFLVIERSTKLAKGLIYAGYDSSLNVSKSLNDFSDEMLTDHTYKSIIDTSKASDHFYNAIALSSEHGKRVEKESEKYQTDMDTQIKKNRNSSKSSHILNQGKNKFISGYLALPDKTATAYEDVQNTKASFRSNLDDASEWRKNLSDQSIGLINDAVINYTDNVSGSFEKAAKEFDSDHEYGITLPMFKSLGWVLEGAFWQGLIKPVSGIAAGSLGYLTTNGVVYPIWVAGESSVEGARIVTEYTKFAGKVAYYVTAPSLEFAFASVLSGGNYLYETSTIGATYGSKAANKVMSVTSKYLVAGTSRAAGAAATATHLVGGAVLNATTYVVSQVGKKTTGIVTKAIILPAAFIGTNAISTGTGIVVAGTGSAVGSTTIATGKAVKLSSSLVEGSIVAAGTLTGTAVSSAYAAGATIYHAGYSVAVPSAYLASSGIVLSYGALTHLGAHTILALGDVSYAVLSLEGPNWVIYGVKGKIKDFDPAGGAVLNLKNMEENGEEFTRVPLSKEESDKLFNKNEK
jgi:hypothetical protein